MIDEASSDLISCYRKISQSLLRMRFHWMANNDELKFDEEVSENVQPTQAGTDSAPENLTSDPAANEHQPAMDDDQHYCRICFDHEDNEDNRLISPCNCTGSQKYIHTKCLKTWQFSVQISSPNHPLFQSQDTRKSENL
eukprot:757529-Hanusia_phi.AAC.1